MSKLSPLRAHAPAAFLVLAALLHVAGCAVRSGPVGEYSVSGTVVGVSPPGVLLTDTNGAGVLVASDGTFTIGNAYARGSRYDIRVASDPALPAVRCTVAKGKGVIVDTDRNDVVVACSGS